MPADTTTSRRTRTPVGVLSPIVPDAGGSDAPAGSVAERAVPVSLVTDTLKQFIDTSFPALWMSGEISDFKAHRNGHWYFCLRDATSQLRCVVWARDQRAIPATPEDGMQVVVRGRLGMYAARGELQVTVTAIEAEGNGLWEKALKQTIATLEKEGLTDPSRRRPIPRVPERIAVITSADGAAYHDIVSVAQRRHAGVQVVLVPAKVQGEGAAESLTAAVERVGRWGGCDTVIIGRGGGAREDLWAFNDLALARAIAACPIPVISAVGHEVDVAVSDLVADLRAATPSAAAEAAVPSRDALAGELAARGRTLGHTVARRVALARERLLRARDAAVRAVSRALETRQAALARAAAALSALNPLAVLARGFAVAQGPDGRALTSIAGFAPGHPFTVTVADGVVEAVTQRVAPRALLTGSYDASTATEQ